MDRSKQDIFQQEATTERGNQCSTFCIHLGVGTCDVLPSTLKRSKVGYLRCPECVAETKGKK